MKLIYFYPIISTIIWGISIVGAKIVSNNGFRPIEIVFLRFALASLLFAPVLYSKSKVSEGYRLNKKSLKPIIGLSITGVAVNNIIFYLGLARTNASVASFIVSFTPLTTMFFATIILHERFTRRKLISVILGIVGVSIIINYSSGGKLLGNLFILLAITIWGSSFSFSKMASDNGLSSIAITGWSQIIGTLMLLPFILNRSSISKYSSLNTETIFWFVYMGVFSSVIAYVLHYRAVADLGAGKVAPTTNIIPFSGAIAAWFLLGDPLHGFAFIGVLIVIIGVIIVQIETVEKSKKKIQKNP